jgi:hypothetical protein
MDNNVIPDGTNIQYVCIRDFEESEKQPFDAYCNGAAEGRCVFDKLLKNIWSRS